MSQFKRQMRRVIASAFGAALCLGTSIVYSAPVVVFGPSPVAPFGGTVIDFEGQADGTLISNQYPGVTFTQDDNGTPQIDNLPMQFGYGPGSGVGVLTGSTNGGATFPTTAGLVAVFSSPMSQVGAFFSDTSPLGGYTFTAFDTGGSVLESFTLTLAQANTNYADCGLFPAITGCGLFVGFDRSGLNDIGKVQFGPSQASSDAFAIDDLRFQGAAVPEPGTLALLGVTLLGIGFRGRKTRQR